MDHPQNEQLLLAQERTDLAKERNRLASTRTYLAWTRTGLASVGGGLAVMRFLFFQNMVHQKIAQWVGATLVLLGILIFFLSFLDFRHNSKFFPHDSRHASSVTFAFLITSILIISAVSLMFIVMNF